jgi:diguanylate cyclase (GGDEF)-like protein
LDSENLNTLREVEGQRNNGEVFPMSLSISKILRAGTVTFVGLVRDISQQRHNEEEIYRLAFYDPLTNLPNRRLLFDRLQQAIHTSCRTDQHGALMFLDLDHFKQLNDSLGHDVGDILLQQVAARLQACVREGDSVARMGGDEFVMLIEALSVYPNEAASQAETIADKILASLAQPYRLREHTYVITPSIGIVVFLHQEETFDELLKKADVAMYQAKTAGRNNARFFDPTMQAAVSVRVALEKSMQLALAQKEFLLHYQLQVDSQGTPTGVEALVRWNHSEHGMVSPAAFIPLAEETGMILALGQWVLETACAQLVEWSKTPSTAHWTMAVNVSISQFAQPSFVANVDKALQKTGANPHQLKLELTESMLAKDVDDVIVKMFEIKALGVTFSLDDFGTGYSSLSYLKRLPLDQLKIDQSFVRDLLTDPNDAAIARTIIALGHSLSLHVIAEGVETLEQRDTLAAMGCDAYQGYYFARPVAVNDLARAIRNIPA